MTPNGSASSGTVSWQPRSSFDVDGKRAQLGDLERETSDPGLWEDQSRAEELTRRLSRLHDQVDRYDRLESILQNLEAMDELLADEADPELTKELESGLDRLERELETVELAALFSGPYDDHDAIATLQAGAGGTESQDWADMLLRMYARWGEKHGFRMEVDEIHHGEEAGIKSATFMLHGPNAYGLLSAERGVHRLVRISPFDAQKRRHTSFAALDVIPLLERSEEEEVEIPEEDLRIDVFRSSGPGGQSVNTTDSAVRITHIPSGIVVACQNERSQLQNRAVALRILKARLAELERRRREKAMNELRGERKAVDFGSQIRSYVLAPYQMVKDHRTDVEVGDPSRVLGGDIDRFIEGELRRRAAVGETA
ncbi:MAG TPA: peptide chain release factor 2 [Actinomycetota bacterium]|nr:peptide chain release factor 2 [Actinomycetota bacterium]